MKDNVNCLKKPETWKLNFVTYGNEYISISI